MEIIEKKLYSKPMMNNCEGISRDLDLRSWLITKPGPKVHIGMEVLMRNFNTLNKRNLAQKGI